MVLLQDHCPDRLIVHWADGVREAEVADLHEAGGQDVLQEPTDELHHIQGYDSIPSAALFLIFESDRPVLDADDSALSNGHFEDVRSKIGQKSFAVADSSDGGSNSGVRPPR